MIFHHQTKKIRHNLTLKIDNTIIERVTKFNLLGIYINENLTWKTHIDYLSSKLARTTGIRNRLKHFLPLDVKMKIYNSLIASHLNYGLLVWGNKSDKIYKLQKKAIRIINLGKYNAHTEPLFKKNRILKLMDIYKLQQQKFYYKFVNHKLPSYFQSFSLERGSRLNHYFTRNINDIPLPRVNHDFAKGTLRNCIPYTINRTPDNIKSKVFTHTLEGFTRYAKNHYIEQYSNDCQIPSCYICNRR